MISRKNPYVKHPADLADIPTLSKFNDWVTDHLAMALGSILGMYLALIIPLVALGVPILYQLVVIISSGWIQCWGLFCLQRSSNRAERIREAKADADHEALTHIANVAEDCQRRLGDLIARTHVHSEPID